MIHCRLGDREGRDGGRRQSGRSVSLPTRLFYVLHLQCAAHQGGIQGLQRAHQTLRYLIFLHLGWKLNFPSAINLHSFIFS